MLLQAAKPLLLATLGLVVAALLGYAVVAMTREGDLLSSVPADAGLALTPGSPKAKSMRNTTDKPVVVSVGADGKAVVQSTGGAPVAPGVGSVTGRGATNGRSSDD
jgi:hypothetical protein